MNQNFYWQPPLGEENLNKMIVLRCISVPIMTWPRGHKTFFHAQLS